MTHEVWGETPQEAVLDHLYEAAAKDPQGFTHDLYGVSELRSEAVMYIEDPDGNCWKITAELHEH